MTFGMYFGVILGAKIDLENASFLGCLLKGLWDGPGRFGCVQLDTIGELGVPRGRVGWGLWLCHGLWAMELGHR